MADLREIVRLGLTRGADLLTAGELRLARALGELDGPAGVVYARLSGRVRPVFCVETLTVPGVEDVAGAIATLRARGLAHATVSPRQRARASTRAHLAAACRALGLSATGRKDELVERVAAHSTWDGRPWVALAGRALVRRLERFAFLQAWPDRGAWVAARLGHVRWPSYDLTTGPGLFRSRAALRRWEALLGPVDAAGALHALERGDGRAPGRLDLTRGLTEVVRSAARDLERVDPSAAAALYAGLSGSARLGGIAVRWARALERAGAPREALAVLARARTEPDTRPSEHVAIGRSGRRLGRALRTGFPPARPPQDARIRELALDAAPPSRGKPRWWTPDGPAGIERAVVAALAGRGRRAVRAEGAPWSTLFALLFADVYFLPVAGALPVSQLAGPLDLGSPAFRAARAEACAEVLAAVRGGRAAARVAAGWARWAGTRLRGARWDHTSAEDLIEIAGAAPPEGLARVLEVLLERGPRAAAGLPDLVVLPGPEVWLEDAFPRAVPPGLQLVEIKGPGDTLRDEQIVWHDVLTRAGLRVEVWQVRARAAR